MVFKEEEVRGSESEYKHAKKHAQNQNPNKLNHGAHRKGSLNFSKIKQSVIHHIYTKLL